MTYKFNGKVIDRSRALDHVLRADPGLVCYFENAHEQSQDGYLARDTVEDQVEGLTLRHSNEEQ